MKTNSKQIIYHFSGVTTNWSTTVFFFWKWTINIVFNIETYSNNGFGSCEPDHVQLFPIFISILLNFAVSVHKIAHTHKEIQ